MGGYIGGLPHGRTYLPKLPESKSSELLNQQVSVRIILCQQSLAKALVCNRRDGLWLLD